MQAQLPSPVPPLRISASRVSRGGEFYFEVQAEGLVRATPEQTWAVLTDYERLPEFVPDLVQARVLARSGGEVRLEQTSRAGFLFLTQLVHMRLRIREEAMAAIGVEQESGDMRHYSARWGLEPAPEGTRVSFSALLEPQFFLPPLLGNPLMQANVKQMVEAVIREIERRSLH